MLTVPDWEALRAHAGLVVCDATVSTPVYLRALDEGADVVVHSATKFLTGSHNALLGATVTRDPERLEALRTIRTLTGTRRLAALGGRAARRARLALAPHAPDHRDGDRDRPPPRARIRPSSSSATPATRG